MRTPPVLWQTEWCPASRRVRQRLTELGVEYVARQVAVEREERGELVEATGQTSIPALVHRGRVVVGGDTILDYLDARFPEPPRRFVTARRRRRRESENWRKHVSGWH